jgi:hypothetical protein
MKLAATKSLYAYWNRLRGERAAPERADIDPAQIRTLLSDVFMLEVDRERGYPLRLSGTRISALFLRELKGEAFVDLWLEPERDDLLAIIESVLDDPTPALLGVQAAASGRQPIELELLLLPLRHLGRTHSRIMGCLTPATHPTWYGLLPVSGLAMTSLKIVNSDGDHHAKLSEFGYGANPTLTQIPLRRRHLSIYSGGLELPGMQSE